MTFLTLHLLFTLPALVLAFWIARKRIRFGHIPAIVGCSILSFVGAALWSLAGAFDGLWSYDWAKALKVEFVALNKTWTLPAEEYVFFVLMALIVGLFCTLFLPRPKTDQEKPGSYRLY